MFGSGILEMGIGMIFLFGLLSLLVSAFQEMLEGILRRRAINLHMGIGRLLESLSAKGRAVDLKDFYSTKTIAPLFGGSYGTEWSSKRELPSKIPPETFAKAVTSLLAQETGDLQRLVGELTGRAGAIEKTGDELIEAAQKELESLYSSMTEGLSAHYKRRTQRTLFVMGFVVAAALNFDTVRVATGLYENPGLRDAIVADAEGVSQGAESFAELVGCGNDEVSAETRKECLEGRLESYSLPIGWSETDEIGTKTPASWIGSVFGWLLSAFAICLGASFWFDLLNKAINFRSTLGGKSIA